MAQSSAIGDKAWTPVYSSTREQGMIWRLRYVISHRNLIWELTARNLKVRYRRSVFGFVWAVLNPLLTALVFTLVFTVLLKSSVDRFVLFFIVGLVVWNAFNASVMESMSVITGSGTLVARVHFPHEVLPISVTLTNMINLLFAMPSVFIIMIVTHTRPGPQIVYFPFILICLFCFALGISFISSATAVFFKDTRNFLDIVMQLWFFLTPIIYRMQDVFPNGQRILYWVNPPASLISSFRLLFYDVAWPDMSFLVRMFFSCAITLVAGWLYFMKLSPKFVEEL